jgi:energy-coupling factor transporter ATP-binding protein EcfA2
MDRFIINKRPKVSEDFLCNKTVLECVTSAVSKNETVCIYGDSGVGKTWLVNYILKGLSRFDVTSETIKDLERVENSVAHIVVDDFELDKELVEKIKVGHKLSKGSLLFITQNASKFDFCPCICFDHPDVSLMVKIALKYRPKESIPKLTKLAIASHGNIRTFLYSIDFDDAYDIFKSPKDFVTDLICDSNEDPRKYIGSVIPEHG